MENIKDCWDLINKYDALCTLSELKIEVHNDLFEFNRLYNSEYNTLGIIYCYTFLKEFDTFLANPDYFVHHEDKLGICVDLDGIRLFPQMVRLYKKYGGTFISDNTTTDC